MNIVQQSLDRGLHAWIQRHGDHVRGLRYTNCVFSPSFTLLSHLSSLHRLEFLCCRLSLPLLRSAPAGIPIGLRILKLHQLMPGDDPGCVTHALRQFTNLEELRITFHRRWGLVSYGPLYLPRLKILSLKSPSHLMVHGDFSSSLDTIILDAEILELVGERPLPPTCRAVCLKSRDSFLNPHDLFPSDRLYSNLTRLEFATMGILFPTFLENIPNLETFRCRCDSFVFTLPLGQLQGLRHLEVAVNVCFVCDTTVESDLRRLRETCDIRATMEEKVYDISTFLR